MSDIVVCTLKSNVISLTEKKFLYKEISTHIYSHYKHTIIGVFLFMWKTLSRYLVRLVYLIGKDCGTLHTMYIKKIIILVVFIAVSLLITQYETKILPEEAKQIETVEVQKELTIQEVLNEVPKKYGVNPEVISKVALCESTHNPNAINYNDGGVGKHSVGIMQYQKSTFDYWEGKLGEDLNYESTYDQVKLASYMISKNRGHEWTCYRKIYGV